MEHREEVFFQDGTLGNIEEMNHLPERSELILIVGEKVEHYAMRREGALIIVEFEGEEVPEATVTEPPAFKEEVMPDGGTKYSNEDVTTIKSSKPDEKPIPTKPKKKSTKKKTEDTAKKLN